jgi:hypothetical protein
VWVAAWVISRVIVVAKAGVVLSVKVPLVVAVVTLAPCQSFRLCWHVLVPAEDVNQPVEQEVANNQEGWCVV